MDTGMAPLPLPAGIVLIHRADEAEAMLEKFRS
jgi:hypothetical protein